MSNGILSDWDRPTWDSINNSVKTAIGNIRVAQRVFLATQLSGVTAVPANILHHDQVSITEGQTKPYIEISAEFTMTYGQVNDDPNGLTGITLAKLAAKSLAMAEDMLFLEGKDAAMPPGVRVESGRESAGEGMLGLVRPEMTFGSGLTHEFRRRDPCRRGERDCRPDQRGAGAAIRPYPGHQFFRPDLG